MSRGKTLVVSVYWLGAVLDGVSVVAMICPSLGGALYGADATAFGPEYRFAMCMGASLMAGWTGLLVWGAFRPLERRGILLLTAVPVVAGLWAATLYAGVSGLADLGRVVPVLVFQAVVFALMIGAWIEAGRLET